MDRAPDTQQTQVRASVQKRLIMPRMKGPNKKARCFDIVGKAKYGMHFDLSTHTAHALADVMNSRASPKVTAVAKRLLALMTAEEKALVIEETTPQKMGVFLAGRAV